MNRRAFMHFASLLMTMVLLLSPLTPVRATAPGRTMLETTIEGPPNPLRPVIGHDVWHGTSPSVRSLPAPTRESVKTREIPFHPIPRLWPEQGTAAHPQTSYQDWIGAPTAMPAPLMSFEGLDNSTGVLPPDTNGDVGINYYIQSVNATVIGIYDKQTGNLVSSFSLGDLWPSGDPCNSSDGDPIVLYDQLAHRWLLSQFAFPNYPNGPYYQCIAISQTDDPVGGDWYVYTYQVHDTKMNDYPHFGVWPDAYYMTANQFTNASSWGGAGVWAFDRDAMLNGQAGTFVYFDLETVSSDYGGMLPADFDGTVPPPTGAPGLFAEWDDGDWIGPNDAIRIWEFHVDWDNPDNSTFGNNGDPNYVIQTEDVDPDMCGGSRNCIPQPGGTPLDAITDRLMYRLQYRNFGDYQTLVSNHTVDVDGNDHAGIHWFELRNAGSGWAMYQEGVFAPDANHRWMGSVAVDHVGNMALGYSVSSSSVYPSIRYTGRLADDPLGVMPQGEGEIVAGSGYQESSYGRWGDYSMMGVDPVDDCTFWYTQEYYASIGTAPWQTRIGSFKFPNCTLGAQGTIEGVVYDASGTPASDGIQGATVSASSSPTMTFQTFTTDGGVYAFSLPTGTYTMTAQAYGYQPAEISGVTVVSGTTTTVNIPLTATASFIVSGTVFDALAGWPLYAHITIQGDPVNPPSEIGDIWTDPVDGFYSVTLASGITYTFQVEAWVEGYTPTVQTMAPLTQNMAVDFPLDPNLDQCSAPGYGYGQTFYEDFSSGDVPAGWTVVDNAGTGAVWAFNDPGDRGNNTGGDDGFAIADSDNAGRVDMDTELRTPVLDFSTLSTITLQFKYDFNSYSDEIADVDVSNDGGATWTNVWERTGSDDRGPKTATIDISSIAGNQSQVMVRFHYYNANWDWFWEVDDVLIGDPAHFVCIPAEGGLVVGNVYDENTSDAVTGATVATDGNETTTAVATVDPNVDDAFYTLFLPVGSHTMTATMSGGYAPDVVSVTPVQSGTIEQNFMLPAAMLDVAPTTLSETLELGEIVTVPFTITNMGTVSATYQFVEVDKGTTPLAPVSIPASSARFRHSKPDMGPAPNTTFVGGNGIVAPLAGKPASAFELSPGNNLVHIPDSDVPGTWDIVNSVSGSFFGADFLNGDFSTLYALDYDTNHFVTVDTATGNVTVIATVPPKSGESWTGLAGTHDGTLYASSTDCSSNSTLYTIDPDSGTATEIGSVTNAGCLIAIAANADGELYGLDLNDVLLQIDPNTAEGTIIGSIGFDAQYAQGMDFEEESGILYLAAYNNTSGQGEMRIADTSTGNTTLVGAFPNGAEVDGLAFESGIFDVPWLSETPASGTAQANGDTTVNIVFDASAIHQPGIYHARLNIRANTPYAIPHVPVTMTALLPATWGQITGTVSGTGHCDNGMMLLDEASILIESAQDTFTITTDSQGNYAAWVQEGTYTVTASATGYTSQSFTLTVTAQQTTTQDFILRALLPCAAATPVSMTATLLVDEQETQTLTMTNHGAISYTFSIAEQDPTATVYTVADSAAANGPTYDWVDISTTGISVTLGDDTTDGPFPIGFGFPFYGNEYTDFYVSSNGFISFSPLSSSAPSNQCPLPNSSTPNNLIALMWDDLDPGDTGDLFYYQSFNDCPYGSGGVPCLIVQYENYHHYGGDIAGTFQAILFKYGSVLIQFEDAGDEQGSGSTTGIENADGTEGLGYKCNEEDSLSDKLAVCFAAPGAPTDCSAPDVPWLSESPITGTVAADGSFPVAVTFDATGMSAGVYTATLNISTSDSDASTILVPVTMTVIPLHHIYLPLVMRGAQP